MPNSNPEKTSTAMSALTDAQEKDYTRQIIGILKEFKTEMTSKSTDPTQRIVGVLGVIGPTRLNYARIIPMVDYTARAIVRLAQER